jgi:hypothetical protein
MRLMAWWIAVANKSMSSILFSSEKLIRSELLAMSCVKPIAVSTGSAVFLRESQAEPVATMQPYSSSNLEKGPEA